MKKIITTLLILLSLCNINSFAQKKDPILKKLLNAAGDKAYLKDFQMNLESGGEARYSLVLSKNTIYSFSVYQNEPNQFEIKLFDNKSKEPKIPTSSKEVNNKITSLEYTIKETGVYHLFITNNSSVTSETVVLLAFADKIEETIDLKEPEKTKEEPESVYFKVDEMPKFKDKENKLKNFNDFIKAELKYPRDAIENKIEGQVSVQFTIGKNGYIKDAKVAREVHPSLDQEALRIIYSSPKWESGIKDGNPVDVVLTFPIVFKLP